MISFDKKIILSSNAKI